jgi:hypothetical protein
MHEKELRIADGGTAPSVKLDDPPFEGDGYGVGTAPRIEFMHDVLAVIVHSPLRDPHDFGYVPGAFPFAHPLQHFSFSSGERGCLFLTFIFCDPGKGLAKMGQGVTQNDFGTAAGQRDLITKNDSFDFRHCIVSRVAAGPQSGSGGINIGKRAGWGPYFFSVVGSALKYAGDIVQYVSCMHSRVYRMVNFNVVLDQPLDFSDKPPKRTQAIAIEALVNEFDQAIGVFFRQIVHIGFASNKVSDCYLPNRENEAGP